ncbi:MAG: CotH kinase family protein, partial [Bacteroidaceae bacterium]|nr:CotH kinase family protein [Bacteroidaceae bacterium]
MKHSYLKMATLICLAILPFCLFAQKSSKLSGSIIGSKYSVDYATGKQSTTVNNKADVFDGNFNTYFSSYDRSNTWVGLDLGTPHVITKVGWSPRAHDLGPERSVLALFEGANDPDFLDAVPLFLNTEASAINKMHYADVNVSRGFRYVRYVGTNDSRCYLSELEFYGYEGVGDDSQFYQITNLPTVSIHTYNGKNPQSKGQDFESNVCIIYDEGTLIQEYPVLTRVRGNASASFPKKPYRIKFNDGKSHRIMKDGKLESPAKAKKWTLINNYGDKSLMR